MEIENIIYLVIGGAWFLWNTYRKSQASKRPTSGESRRKRSAEPEPATEPVKSLEDMILGQFGEKKTVPEPIVAQPQRHKHQDKFLNNDLSHKHLPDDYEMSKSEMKSHRVERQVRKLDNDEVEEESMLDQIMPEGFDLRKAVVMNAVLERPYS